MRWAVAILLLGSIGVARGEILPEQVGIVASKLSVESIRLADHYAKVRGIPKSNVLLLDVAPVEEVARADWEAKLRPALARWLAEPERQSIRCLVTCLGVPLKVGRRSAGDSMVVARRQLLSDARRTYVEQIVAMTRLLEDLPSGSEPGGPRGDVKLDASVQELSTALDATFKAASERIAKIEPAEQRRAPLGAVEQLFFGASGLGGALRAVQARNDAAPAAEVAQRLELVKGQSMGLQEALAALAALPETASRDAQTIRVVQKLGGMLGVLRWIDSELEAIDKNETYAALDSELALVLWPDYPLYRWQPNPLHYAQPPAYQPKPTYVVSRLAAPSLERAMKLVDAAVAVEKAGLSGKFYIDARGLAKSDQHGSFGQFDQSLRDLAARLQKQTRLPVVLDDKPALFAPGACPQTALYCGWYSLGNYVESFEWLPGSVGYHLASSEAQTLTTPGNRAWCNAMLERGVTATLGPVYEPYLIAFPLPDDFFPLLLTGQNLGETYWRTTPFTSWVMTLVGDPLYSPFRAQPVLSEADLPERMRMRRAAPASR